MFFTDFVAELAHFPICPLVAPIGMVVYKIDSIEDDVIMAMPLVDVGGDHIFILAFQPFVGKLFSDFMRHLRRDFSDVEGLNILPMDFIMSGQVLCRACFRRCIPS